MTHFSIFGYYGQGNAGDEAILTALIDGITSNIKNSTVSVYSSNPTETKATHNIEAYRPFGLDIKFIIKSILGRSRRHYLRSLINFFRSDVIVIGGGGLFFDTKETNKWMYGYLDLIEKANFYNKKVALVGISVGPLHHEGSRTAIKNSLSKVNLISVRDTASKNLLIDCGIAADKIKVIPDLVFTLHSAPDTQIEKIIHQENFVSNGKPNIALTPCCYNLNQQGWLASYISLCEKIISELDCNIWLIPMQRNNNHDDLFAINSIVSNLDDNAKERISILERHYTAKEVQGILGKANFIFAERLHGSIMALNTSVPFMSIAYMPKVVGVLELAKLQDNIISYESFLSGDFLQKAVSTAREKINGEHPSNLFERTDLDIAHLNFAYLKNLANNTLSNEHNCP